jgi:hypothetical protein
VLLVEKASIFREKASISMENQLHLQGENASIFGKKTSISWGKYLHLQGKQLYFQGDKANRIINAFISLGKRPPPS